MFEPKPDIRPPRTRLDSVIEIITLVGLLALIIWPLLVLPTLPQQIPIHFNFSGQPTNFGHRAWILLLPGVGVFTWLLLSGVGLLPPKYYNYPVPIIEENAPTQYRLARDLLRLLKLEIVMTFLVIESMMIASARSGAALASWPIILVLVVVFGTIAWYLIQSIRSS